MIIRDYCLFKLPIDNSYENVFDEYTIGHDKASTIANYVEVLSGIYPYKTSTQDIRDFVSRDDYPSSPTMNRSEKINNGISNITLYEEYFNVKDYNYIIIKTDADNGYDFIAFFVTNVVSQNDNSTRPSCSFTLVYDVWTNNYHDIHTKVYNKYSSLYRGHIERTDGTNLYANVGQNRYFPVLGEEYVVQGDKARIVFVDVFATKDTSVTASKSGSTLIPMKQKIKSEYPYGDFNHYFYPFAYISNDGKIYTNDEIWFYYNTKTEQNITLAEGGFCAKEYSPNKIIGDDRYIVSARLTTFTNFQNITITENWVNESDGKTYVLMSYNAIEKPNDFVFGYDNTGEEVKPCFCGNIQIPYITQLITSQYTVEPALSVSPFVKFYIDIMGNKIEIPTPLTKIDFRYYVYITEYGYIVKLIDNVNNSTKILRLDGVASITYTLDTFNVVLNSNAINYGARLVSSAVPEMSTFFGAKDLALSALSDNPINRKARNDIEKSLSNTNTKMSKVNTKSFIQEAISIGSELATAYSAPDKYSIPSSNGVMTAPYFDRPVIIVKKYVENNYNNSLIKDIKKFGYYCNNYIDVVNGNRFLYDYVQSEFEIPVITNDFERSVLQSIYSDGFTRWHIKNFSSNKYTQDEKDLIKNLYFDVENNEKHLEG